MWCAGLFVLIDGVPSVVCTLFSPKALRSASLSGYLHLVAPSKSEAKLFKVDLVISIGVNCPHQRLRVPAQLLRRRPRAALQPTEHCGGFLSVDRAGTVRVCSRELFLHSFKHLRVKHAF
jgi:hypothetical protein